MHHAGIGGACEKIACGGRPRWMPELRGDLGKRRKNELALEHAGMRDLQFGSVERQIAEEKDVYIEEPRTFGESFLAAELRFDGAKSVEKFDGL